MTPMAIAGTMMLLGPGLGLVPPLRPEKDEEIVAAWSTVAGVELPPALFFVFIGTCKATGVLAMWDTFGTSWTGWRTCASCRSCSAPPTHIT